MTVIEVGREERGQLTLRQRWSHYLVLVYALTMLIVGVNLRDSLLYATVPYEDVRAGIRAFYPQGWLLDNQGDYVFRVRDMRRTDFKTTIQVQILPVSADSTTRNLLDNLLLTRAQIFGQYRQFPRAIFQLPDETPATSVNYTFVASQDDPFLESFPTVVAGQDVVILQREQAVIITFQASADEYDTLYPVFQTFLADLEF
jgi:hypothetical protein